MRRIGYLLIFFLAVTNFLLPQQFDLISNKSPDEIRILKILIVADQGYREQIPGWQEEITELVKTVSSAFEQRVGIKLEIAELKNWKRDTKGHENRMALLRELFNDFPRAKNANFDVVIGLTSHYLEGARGCAWTYPAYILITSRRCLTKLDKNGEVESEIFMLLTKEKRVITFPSLIPHELGHIFGCDDHATNKNCAMYTNVNAWPTSFCNECIETIKKNKWRKFPVVKN